MAVFHNLCRIAQSSRAHRTESVSVMGHAWSAAVFQPVIAELYFSLILMCSGTSCGKNSIKVLPQYFAYGRVS